LVEDFVRMSRFAKGGNCLTETGWGMRVQGYGKFRGKRGRTAAGRIFSHRSAKGDVLGLKRIDEATSAKGARESISVRPLA
jgi:hypothetical protein